MPRKIYMLTDIAHPQKAPITPSLEHVPDTQSSIHRQKYYHLFQTKRFKCPYKKKYTLLNIILDHGKNLQDLRGQNYCKNN